MGPFARLTDGLEYNTSNNASVGLRCFPIGFRIYAVRRHITTTVSPPIKSAIFFLHISYNIPHLLFLYSPSLLLTPSVSRLHTGLFRWQIGGYSSAQFGVSSNTDFEVI